MDLRQYDLSADQVARAASVLDYQPFQITDDLQTGAAYSWLAGLDPELRLDQREAPPLLFRRDEWSDRWDHVTDANRRLARFYDDIVAEVASRYPGGSFLDVACNNGYFPVRASLNGMKASGFDMGPQFADSIGFLNDVSGASAAFEFRRYDPGAAPEASRRFDVVSASAIMCHLPDPLHFLAFLGAHAAEAILFWGQVIDTEHLLTAYNRPHAALSWERPFPYSFNDNTRVSLGLFREAVRQMGFSSLEEIPPRPEWLSLDDGVAPGWADQIAQNRSRHMVLLATR